MIIVARVNRKPPYMSFLAKSGNPGKKHKYSKFLKLKA